MLPIIVSRLYFDVGVEVDSVRILLASSIVSYLNRLFRDKGELPRHCQLSSEIDRDRQNQRQTEADRDKQRQRQTETDGDRPGRNKRMGQRAKNPVWSFGSIGNEEGMFKDHAGNAPP